MWIYDHKLMYSVRLDTENAKVYSTSFTETLHEQNFMISRYNKERLPSPDIMNILYKFPPKFVKPLRTINIYIFFDGSIDEFVQFVPRLKKYFSLFVVVDVFIINNIEFVDIVMNSFDAKRFVLVRSQSKERITLSKIPHTIRASSKVHHKIGDCLSNFL
jgi:hypothetical protein